MSTSHLQLPYIPVPLSQPTEIDKLLTLLVGAKQGAIVIATYDDFQTPSRVTRHLQEELHLPVIELVVSETNRNPVDLITYENPKPQTVISLYNIGKGLPESFQFLDTQREVLVELSISVICWVTNFEAKLLAAQSPNFYSFRSAIFNFSKNEISSKLNSETDSQAENHKPYTASDSNNSPLTSVDVPQGREPLIRVVCPVCASVVMVNALGSTGVTDSLCSKCAYTVISVETDEAGTIIGIAGVDYSKDVSRQFLDWRIIAGTLLGVLALLLLFLLIKSTR